MTDLDTILTAAHRKNIARYKRLLRTPLTELERDFVLRRLAEERRALREAMASRHSAEPFPTHIMAPSADGAAA